jgi:hypothetical protein
MHKLIEEYLIHSYLYYAMDSPVISDVEFDALCKKLLDSGVEHSLISKEDLAAGTGYSIQEYPGEIVAAAEHLLKETHKPASKYGSGRLTPWEFNGSTTETYLLCGVCIDYGLAHLRERQAELQVELKRRWDEDIHKDQILQYCKDHNVTPERFKI